MVIYPIHLKIMDGMRTKFVHVNRLQHRVQPQPGDGNTRTLNTIVPADSDTCVSPQVDHIILTASPPLPALPRR